MVSCLIYFMPIYAVGVSDHFIFGYLPYTYLNIIWEIVLSPSKIFVRTSVVVLETHISQQSGIRALG